MTSKIGFRKHLENAKRFVSHKWNDTITFNVGTSKQSEEKETSTFSLFITTQDNEFHLMLNRSDTKRMIEFFKDKL